LARRSSLTPIRRRRRPWYHDTQNIATRNGVLPYSTPPPRTVDWYHVIPGFLRLPPVQRSAHVCTAPMVRALPRPRARTPERRFGYAEFVGNRNRRPQDGAQAEKSCLPFAIIRMLRAYPSTNIYVYLRGGSKMRSPAGRPAQQEPSRLNSDRPNEMHGLVDALAIAAKSIRLRKSCRWSGWGPSWRRPRADAEGSRPVVTTACPYVFRACADPPRDSPQRGRRGSRKDR